MNLTNILCFFVQPCVNSLQALLDVMYIPLSFLGIHAPPVSSWFQSFLPCIT
jgi:hypothetical protein